MENTNTQQLCNIKDCKNYAEKWIAVKGLKNDTFYLCSDHACELYNEDEEIKTLDPMSGVITTYEVAEYEVCEFCGGTGEVTVDEAVYPGEPHMAAIGTKKCVCQIKEHDGDGEDD